MAKKRFNTAGRVPKDESKADKFERVVIPRVIRAEKAIRLIGNCASSSYGYEQPQIEQIKGTLFTALTQVIDKFSSTKKGVPTFEFKK